MPLTLRRHAVQKPPTGPLKLDIGNPLARNLEAFWVLNEMGSRTGFDVSGHGKTMTMHGSPWMSSAAGTALKGDGSTVWADLANGSSMIANSARTLWVLAIIGPDPASATHLAGFRDGGGGAWFFITHENFGGNLSMQDGFSPNYKAYVVPGLGLHSFALTDDGTTTGISVDGVSAATGTGVGSSGVSASTATFSLFSDQQWNVTYNSDTILAAGIWSRALSASEQLSLNAEPYQLFQTRPMQRWFVTPTQAVEQSHLLLLGVS